MRVSDIILEEPNLIASQLVQVLRTVINSADQNKQSVYLHFTKPNREEIRTVARTGDAPQQDAEGDKVGAMAKSATDLGDKL